MKRRLSRIALLVIALVIAAPLVVPPQLLAYNAAERKSLMQKDIIFIDDDVCSAGGNGVARGLTSPRLTE